MKNFFGNRKNVMSVSTICIILLTLIAVTHYYLQYDVNRAIGWTLSFGYLFLFVQSVFTLGYGVANKKSDVKLISIEFIILSVVMLAYAILSIIPVSSVALRLKPVGLILPVVFIPVCADAAIVKKPLIKNLFYLIPSIVLVVAAAVLANINVDEADLFSQIASVIAALFFIFGIVLAIINIAKNSEDLFGWALMAYSFMGALMFVLRIFEKVTLADKFISLQNLAASVMLMAIISIQQVPAVSKKKKR